MRTLALTLFALALLPALSAAAADNVHADPEGAFAFKLPAKWSAHREKIDARVAITACSHNDDDSAEFNVLTVPLTQQLDAAGQKELRAALIQLGLKTIQEDNTLASSRASETTFKSKPALRTDVTFSDEDGEKYKRYLIAVVGNKFGILLSVTGPVKDAASFKAAEGALASLAIESKKPGGSSSIFTAASLKKTAGAALGKPAETDDTILVAGADGAPPLTVGSVRNFCAVIEKTFDIRLTDAEFEVTRQRFIEYYDKNDARGKATLATGGANLLKQITTGTPEQIEANLKESREVMSRYLANGAKAGIESATALNDAVNRRRETMAKVTGERPRQAGQQQIKTELTEAALDASIEMLYFMWVACGRNAGDVTPEAVAAVRASIAANFATLPGELQYTFANAETLYPQVKATYLAADPGTRAVYAQQFSQGLDALGLADPRVQSAQANTGRQKSAWDDVNPDEARYGLVVNTAWNLAQKSTR